MTKVLIVDDSDVVRTSMVEYLEERGLEAVSAVDGVNGLRELREHPDIELVITDVNMPNMDGLSMVEKIRNEMGRSDLKVIVLTTEESAKFKARGAPLSITGWAVKPITDKFADIVEAIVRGPGS